MKTLKSHHSGFTIAEVLISSAILSMIAAGVVAGAMSLQKSFLASSEFSSARIEQLRVLDAMKRDARGATSAEVRNSGSTVVFNVPTGAPSLLQLGLPATVRQLLGGGSATPATKNVTYTIFDNRVLRTEEGHTETMAVKLSRFYVAPSGGDLLATVAFQSRYAAHQGTPEETPGTRLIAAVKVRRE